MKLSEHQRIFTKHISLLIEYAYSIGIELTFGEAYRTVYQQEEYIRQGKSKTMKSKHLNRLAVDFNFFIDGKLTYTDPRLDLLGDYWEDLDELNRAGMFWKWRDSPHFERNI